MTTTKHKWVDCSDWQLSWGFGTTCIGKLRKGETPLEYVWKGKRQGRHGQVYMGTHEITFYFDPESDVASSFGYIRSNKGDSVLPVTSELLKAIELLEAIEELNKL